MPGCHDSGRHARARKSSILNALGLPRYDTPEYFLALRKDGADEIVDLSRQDLRTAYASKFTQQSTKDVDIILDARGILRCCDSLTTWSDPLVVIGFEAGGTPVVKANYLLLKISGPADCR